MKKKFTLIAILIIVMIVLFIYFWINRTIYLHENAYFKKVYSSQNDINTIEIDIKDARGKTISTITNKTDIITIMNAIKNEKINPNVGLGETLLGASYCFVIRNNLNNNELEMAINNSQIILQQKTYKTESNMKEKVKEIYLKYTLIPST